MYRITFNVKNVNRTTKLTLFPVGRAHLRGDHVLYPDRPLVHHHREDHRPHREDRQHPAEEQHGTGREQNYIERKLLCTDSVGAALCDHKVENKMTSERT